MATISRGSGLQIAVRTVSYRLRAIHERLNGHPGHDNVLNAVDELLTRFTVWRHEMGPSPGQDGSVCLTSFLETDSRLELSLFDLLKDIQDYAAQVIRESETANWEAQPTRNPNDKEQTSQEIPRKATFITTGLLEALAQSISALFRLSRIARDSGKTQNVELQDQPIQAVLVKRRMVMARAYLSPGPPKPTKQSLDAAVEEAVAELNYTGQGLGIRQLPLQDEIFSSREEQIRDKRSLQVSHVDPFKMRDMSGKEVLDRLAAEDDEAWDHESDHSWVEHDHALDEIRPLPTPAKPAVNIPKSKVDSTVLDPVLRDSTEPDSIYLYPPPRLRKAPISPATPSQSPSPSGDYSNSFDQQRSRHTSIESELYASQQQQSASNRDSVVHPARGDGSSGLPKEPSPKQPDDFPKPKAQKPQRRFQSVLNPLQRMNVGNPMMRFLPTSLSRNSPAPIDRPRFQKLSSVYLRLPDHDGEELGWSERLLVKRVKHRRGVWIYQLKDMMDNPFRGGKFFEQTRLRWAPDSSPV